MFASLVAPRFDFYLLFLNYRGGSNQSLVVLRPNAKGEENHPSMASKQHTSFQKACSWYVLVLCHMVSENKDNQHIKRHI